MEIYNRQYNTPVGFQPSVKPETSEIAATEPEDKIALHSEEIRKSMDALNERAENHTLSQFTSFKNRFEANMRPTEDLKTVLMSTTAIGKFIGISLSGSLTGGTLGGIIGGAAG